MIDQLLGEDADLRQRAIERLAALPEEARVAAATKLVPLARDARDAFDVDALERLLPALARLRVDGARDYLLRLADEESVPLKTALVRALRGTDTKATRAVFLHLLSDPGMQAEAVVAIGEAPWRGVLPDLIELAESSDAIARVALPGIVRCAAHGQEEAYAAYDFLTELLSDPRLRDDARVALQELHRSEIL